MFHFNDEDKSYLKTIEEKYDNKIYFLGISEEDFYQCHDLLMVKEEKYDFVIMMYQGYYRYGDEKCTTIRDKFNPLQKFKNLNELQNYLDKHYKKEEK